MSEPPDKTIVRVENGSPQYSKNHATIWQQVTGSVGLILAILFLVTGALGLPLLWYSPKFSYRAKWFWSIVVSIYTLLLIAVTIAIVWRSYLKIVEGLR